MLGATVTETVVEPERGDGRALTCLTLGVGNSRVR